MPARREKRQADRRLASEADELPGPVGWRIDAIAARQAGAITHRQLLDAGLSGSSIDRRVRGGELHRVHRGVFLVGHRAMAPLATEWAALLACGEGAVISHASAAHAWRLTERAGATVEVTVSGRQARCRPNIRVHETASLPPTDVRLIDRLPVTSPARTILDLAASGHPELERMISEAHARRLIGKRDLDALRGRARRRRGAAALRRLLESESSGYTRSAAERRLRALLRAARLPQPLTNARLHGREVDFHWPDRRLIVEVDGYAAHGHRAAFEHDRRKDAMLTAAGFQVIRFTWRQLTEEALLVAGVIAQAIAARHPHG